MSSGCPMGVDWDCDVDGCFNIKKRLKFSVFADCFPRKINFGDVDGIVEIGGHGLTLEWKERPGILKKGQRVLWENLTRGKMLAVIVVAGDAEDMSVTHQAAYWNGKWRDWRASSIDDLRVSIKKWVAWAEDNPLV
jgi:hypothetical protein